MRYTRLLAALVLFVSTGVAQACPESGSSQTQSTTIEKPLAPKPSA